VLHIIMNSLMCLYGLSSSNPLNGFVATNLMILGRDASGVDFAANPLGQPAPPARETRGANPCIWRGPCGFVRITWRRRKPRRSGALSWSCSVAATTTMLHDRRPALHPASSLMAHNMIE
jgi:hypothetical protein